MQRCDVSDMSCGQCVQKIEKAVKGVDPQAEVSIDLSSRQVTVQTGADETRVSEAIREAGYDNTPAARYQTRRPAAGQ